MSKPDCDTLMKTATMILSSLECLATLAILITRKTRASLTIRIMRKVRMELAALCTCCMCLGCSTTCRSPVAYDITSSSST